MKILLFLALITASTVLCAQTITRGMNWINSSGIEYTYTGEISDGKPEGVPQKLLLF